MRMQNKTSLSKGNAALRSGQYTEAIRHFAKILTDNPGLGKSISYNLALARKKYLKGRIDAERQRVAVCGWELSHNAAGRVYTLAKLYETFAETEIIGCIFPGWGREIWGPIREASFAKRIIIIEDEAVFIEQAIRLIAANPYDIVHLSKPRASNILIGILYKLVWGAKIVMDIDDEELAFVGSEAPISLDSCIKQYGRLPETRDLCGKVWTQIAVGLAREFDGVTVCNAALREHYGGEIIRHARDEKFYNPSLELKRKSREKYSIPQDKKVVLFFGTPRAHKGLIETAKAIAALKRQDIIFVVVGDFVDANYKEQLLATNGVEFRLMGNQPFANIPEVVAIGDICILLQGCESKVANFQTPAKLSDALAMGLTVLVENSPGLKELIAKGELPVVNQGSLSNTLREALAKPPVDLKPHPLFLECLSMQVNCQVLTQFLNSIGRRQQAHEELSPQLDRLMANLSIYSSALDLLWKKTPASKFATPTALDGIAGHTVEVFMSMAEKATTQGYWEAAYSCWKSLLLRPDEKLSVDLLLRISKELFQLDAFDDANNALQRAVALDPNHTDVICEQAEQYYYHCYSSWLMLIAENESDWYKADGLETRPDWQTACYLIEKAEKVSPRNNLRRYVQSYLLLAEEMWDSCNLNLYRKATRQALGVVATREWLPEVAQQLLNAAEGFRSRPNEEATIKAELRLRKQIGCWDHKWLSVNDWLCLSDIFNWNGLLFCGYAIRQLAANQAIFLGEKQQNNPSILIVALRAALYQTKFDKAAGFRQQLVKQWPNVQSVKELDAYTHLLQGDVQSFREKWPNKTNLSDRAFAEFVQGKRVAIVGPAPSDEEVGKEIDGFDVVIRINYRGGDRLDKAEITGRKTNVSIYNAHTIRLLQQKSLEELNRLQFILIRRGIADKRCWIYLCKGRVRQISENSHLFYKSTNAATALIFDLMQFKTREIKVFHVNFYEGMQHHNQGYRQGEEDRFSDFPFRKLQPVLANHDLISQRTCFPRNINISSYKLISNQQYILKVLDNCKPACGLPHFAGKFEELAQDTYFKDKLDHKEKPTKNVLKLRENEQHDWYFNNELASFLYSSWLRKHGFYLPKSIRRVLVIGHELNLNTGVFRPISHYLNFLFHHGGYSIKSIEFDVNMELQYINILLQSSDLIIVNSVQQLAKVANLRKAVKNIYNKVPIFCYLHETTWTLNNLSAIEKERLRQVIPCLHLLLCSYKQIEDINVFNKAISYDVVRNPSVAQDEAFSVSKLGGGCKSETSVIMVGLVQKRKGTDFFSRCADRIVTDKQWRFCWAGPIHDPAIYMSPNVEFVGKLDKEKLDIKLSESDIFFLSSYDDPFPLSAVEAYLSGCKLLLPKVTGLVEVFDGMSGVLIYDEHEIENVCSMLYALSLKEPPSLGDIKKLHSLIGLAPFLKRMNVCISNHFNFKRANIAERLYSPFERVQVAVIIHVYYTDLLFELSRQLESVVDFTTDIYLSVTADKSSSKLVDFIQSILSSRFRSITVLEVENRGLDVGPFFEYFSKIKDMGIEYDYVLKIHGKKSIEASGVELGNSWRVGLISGLMGTRENTSKIINIFEREHKLGILAPSSYIIKKSENDIKFGLNERKVNSLKSEYNLTGIGSMSFVRGTMFWARFEYLFDAISKRPIPKLADFEEGYKTDSTLAHAYERLLSWIPQKKMPIYSYKPKDVSFIASHIAFENKHAGQDIYVLCSGPTLEMISSDFFANKITIGVNSVTKKVRCTYGIFKEYTSPEHEYSTLDSVKAVFVSLFKSGNRRDGVVINNNDCFRSPLINYFDHEENKRDQFDVNPLLEKSEKLFVSWSTVTSAIHLAAFMGAKNIILVGHDCGQINDKLHIKEYSNRDDGSIDAWEGNKKEYVNWLTKIEQQTIAVRNTLRENNQVNIISLNPFINLSLEGNQYCRG